MRSSYSKMCSSYSSVDHRWNGDPETDTKGLRAMDFLVRKVENTNVPYPIPGSEPVWRESPEGNPDTSVTVSYAAEFVGGMPTGRRTNTMSRHIFAKRKEMKQQMTCKTIAELFINNPRPDQTAPYGSDSAESGNDSPAANK